MHILKIEYPIRDPDTWKAVLDRDPVGRRQSDHTHLWTGIIYLTQLNLA